MKQYYLRETTPLKYHKFLRWFGLPLSLLLNLGQVVSMLINMENFYWAMAVDLAFYLAQLVLVLTALIGFHEWKPFGWYSIVAVQWVGIGYVALVFLFNAVFLPSEIPSALGGLIGTGIVSALVLIYYNKRRPLFFLAAVPTEYTQETNGGTAEVLYCTKCGERILDGGEFCHKCGAPVVR